MLASTRRRPIRSPSVPSSGDASVPMNCSAPKAVSHSTEPVCTSTYQPRISVSISSAQAVHRSAGHWKRKLRVANGARNGQRAVAGGKSGEPSAARAMARSPVCGRMVAGPGRASQHLSDSQGRAKIHSPPAPARWTPPPTMPPPPAGPLPTPS